MSRRNQTVSPEMPATTCVAPTKRQPHSGTCPACGSQRHSQLFGTVRREGQGEFPVGARFVAVSISRTKCLDCGQLHLVREYHREAEPAPA